MTMFRSNYSGAKSSSFGSPGGAMLNRNMSNFKLKTKKIKRIGTWNVRTMAQAGKIQCALQEMDRMHIEIMGVSEMRWPNASYCDIDEYRVYYSGSTNNRYENGVGIIVHQNVSRSVTNFVPVNERIILLQISATPVNMNIVQVYAPTTDHSDEEIIEFYSEINNVIKNLPKHEMLILLGDFNAKIGRGKEGSHIGPYGLGDRNERGDLLSLFALEQNLVILNTFYKLPARRLYTWKSPGDEESNTRNQIDFILVNHRYRNSFTSVKTYPGADIHSDHNPVVGEYRIKLKKIRRKNTRRYKLRILKDKEIKEKAKKIINDQINLLIEKDSNTEETIQTINRTVENIKEELLKPSDAKNKTWMTNEILKLMEERRKHKNNNPVYKQIQRELQRKIREAKQKELEEKCQEIEDLQRKYDEFNVHKKVREITGKHKKKVVGKLLNDKGELIIDRRKIQETWKKYIEDLFYDERVDPPSVETETGPEIIPVEVKAAIFETRDGKAAGPDGIQSEFLKLLDEDSIKFLCKIFNNIYNTGNIPREWLLSEFVMLPKKQGAKKCEDYRGISLMSHLLKIFLKIIHKRIYKICEERISDTQFGFMKGVGTRDALFSIQVLFQRCRDVNCDIFACFIDYEKAFDKIQHEKMMQILKDTGIDGKNLRIIRNLYWNQSASIRLNSEECTDEVNIRRGVRQGCILSPLIFNLYSEEIFNEALEGEEHGILVNGERLNNIRYADDTVVFADNIISMQRLIDKISEASERYGLKVNINKTKFMIISKNTNTRGQLFIRNIPIQRVSEFTYLGTVVNEQWDHSQEIKVRIEKARSAFKSMDKLFKSHNLNLEIKIRLLRCYILSILYYGVESWTLTKATEKRLEAFEMWLYRRILKIPWVDKVSNRAVLERIGKQKEIMNTIKRRKLEYLGHIMRNEGKYHLLISILQGKVFGKRGPGRRRISWLKNLRTWFTTTTKNLFRAAANKIIIARMIANIRNE